MRCREGREPVEYPWLELKRGLGKTPGVPLVQEQVMRVAIECAGATPAEADQLRQSLATFEHTGERDGPTHGRRARGMTISDLRLGTGIKVRTHAFRQQAGRST
jgi:hypothetical protein